MDKTRLIELLNKWRLETIAASEMEELKAFIREEENKEAIISMLTESASEITAFTSYDKDRFDPLLQNILNADRPHVVSRSGPRVRQMYKWIAAASIIIIAALSIVISNQWSRKAGGSIGEKSPSHDVPAPTNTRAVITLADGRKVYLDSASNGTIAQENNVEVVKNERGEIIYSHKDTKAQIDIAYNTLYNPRGSKVISLTLSDGTKVWLNSESSLKYPIAFNGDKREVEITGEAYFEVKHNSKQPFTVYLPNGSIVEDIGTSFNINAYPDEDATKTTLIEGSVKVSAKLPDLPFSAVILKPNQQSVQTPQSRVIRVQNNIDIEDVLAWKNGIFQFKASGIEAVMKQIARWYDVDIVYQDKLSQVFYGTIPRDVSAANVFKVLEETGGVHFKIEGRKVIVLK